VGLLNIPSLVPEEDDKPSESAQLEVGCAVSPSVHSPRSPRRWRSLTATGNIVMCNSPPLKAAPIRWDRVRSRESVFIWVRSRGYAAARAPRCFPRSYRRTSRLPPPLRERSRLPMQSAPPKPEPPRPRERSATSSEDLWVNDTFECRAGIAASASFCSEAWTGPLRVHLDWMALRPRLPLTQTGQLSFRRVSPHDR
jgi:hypothetical protein